MQLKTHFVIGVFALILFLPVVNHDFLFGLMVVVGTCLPDIDTPFSSMGQNKISKFVQVFTKHRGMIHSLTFCFLISLLLAIFIPILAFGFFLGYSLHLVVDCFTKSGIKPFWPINKYARGFLVTGGIVEKGIFLVFLVADFVLIAVRLMQVV